MKHIEAMQKAIDAIEAYLSASNDEEDNAAHENLCDTRAALREALAEQAEPVVAELPPENCRQRLKAESKAYLKSDCAVCGPLSPKFRECDAMLAAAPAALQEEPCDMGQMCLNCQPRGPNGECPDKQPAQQEPPIYGSSAQVAHRRVFDGQRNGMLEMNKLVQIYQHKKPIGNGFSGWFDGEGQEGWWPHRRVFLESPFVERDHKSLAEQHTKPESTKQALEKALEMLKDNREYIEANERPEYLALYDKAIADAEKAMEEQAGPVPEGWKLVPVEPTKEMCEAAEKASVPDGDAEYWPFKRDEAPHVYAAMLAYAPAAPQAEQPAQQELVEMSPDFTDTARSALLWVLWHHQGSSSPVGQPIRFALGIGAHERLTDFHIADAKRWAKQTNSTAAEFHQPAQQEPIGYLWPTGRHPEFRFTQQKRDGVDGTPVYTAPPQRQPWVGLADEEVTSSRPYSITRDKGCFHAGAKWADAKLREKNAAQRQPLTDEQCRAKFEAWYSSAPDADAEPERTYELTDESMSELTKECIWLGWQAAHGIGEKQ